jgi:hypothetical protein
VVSYHGAAAVEAAGGAGVREAGILGFPTLAADIDLESLAGSDREDGRGRAPRPPGSNQAGPPWAPYRSNFAWATPAGTIQVWAAPVYSKMQVTVVPLVVQSPEAACAGVAASPSSGAIKSASASIRLRTRPACQWFDFIARLLFN